MATPTPSSRWILAVNRSWKRRAEIPITLKKFPKKAVAWSRFSVARSTAQLNWRSTTWATITVRSIRAAISRRCREPASASNPPLARSSFPRPVEPSDGSSGAGRSLPTTTRMATKPRRSTAPTMRE